MYKEEWSIEWTSLRWSRELQRQDIEVPHAFAEAAAVARESGKYEGKQTNGEYKSRVKWTMPGRVTGS